MPPAHSRREPSPEPSAPRDAEGSPEAESPRALLASRQPWLPTPWSWEALGLGQPRTVIPRGLGRWGTEFEGASPSAKTSYHSSLGKPESVSIPTAHTADNPVHKSGWQRLHPGDGRVGSLPLRRDVGQRRMGHGTPGASKVTPECPSLSPPPHTGPQRLQNSSRLHARP